MPKKITQKEFKEILNNAGLNFDIWGYEGILNIISIYCTNYEAPQNKSLGFESLALTSLQRGDFIYNELKKKGYYTSNK